MTIKEKILIKVRANYAADNCRFIIKLIINVRLTVQIFTSRTVYVILLQEILGKLKL